MRTVKEWIGKTDDSPVPPRVRLRVADKFGMRCAMCFQQLIWKGMELDHEIALINGGQHRESNLVALCKPCHKHKTALDVLAKKRMAAARKRWLGVKKTRNPVPGSKASKWAKRYNRATGRFETVRRDGPFSDDH